MEKILQQILEEMQGIKKEQTTHSQELKGIKEQLNNMQGQLAENTRFISALSQDVARTATKEDIATLSSGIEALNTRLFKQESELILLKTAK
jgi:predicted  nucleic acid-binding Zn-ribbon protein